MSQIPIQVFLVPIIGFLAVAYTFYSRRTMGKKHDAQFANFRAGELAQRLGLRLVEGDPAFNLFIRYANVDVMKGPSDKKPVHVSVRMQGEPHGLPTELVYLYRVEQETSYVANTVTWKTWFDCRMIVFARRPFPPFEVTSRSTPFGPIAQIQPLPPQPTGNPAIDGTYAVSTPERGVAQLLGQVLVNFGTFATAGVHLVGDGQTVAFVMKQDKPPIIGSALYFAEQMSALLSDLARRLGG